MAEEDLIFGKNRHLFGGIEPSNMLSFTAASIYDAGTGTAKVKITAKLPKETSINGQTLCTVGGAVIRRSTTGFPEDEFSGTLVANITADSELVDDNVEVATTYYYAAFPYTKQGVYNRSGANRASVTTYEHTYLFGYDLNLSDSDPSTRVTYPSDVDNANYTPAAMNFSAGTFNYGGWPNTPGDKFMPKPCMLSYGGTVSEYLDPDDYTKTESGANSQVANTAFEGNAMMEWSKIYTKRWEENGIYHFRCSDVPQDGEWDCLCNYDRNNNKIDHFYTPIYCGSVISNRLRSISGANNRTNAVVANEITYAKANGDDWYIEVLADWLLIQDLLVMMSKSTECQAIFGYGRCKTNNTSAIGNGTMDTKGMFWGSNDQTSGVKVFGMENWWGNLWRFTAGWIFVDGVQKVKLTRGTHDGSIATDYNTDGNGYISVFDSAISGTSGGYISSMKTEAYGRLPVAASGSSSTYEADSVYFGTGKTFYAQLAGSWNEGLKAGPFHAKLNNDISVAGNNRCAALSCKPLAG